MCVGLLLLHHGYFIGLKILAKVRFMIELKGLLNGERTSQGMKKKK